MSHRIPFTDPHFGPKNMKVLKNLLEEGRQKYRHPPAKEEGILSKEKSLNLKSMFFAMKPFDLMWNFENEAYFEFIHEIAKRVLAANQKEVLYCCEGLDSKIEFGGPIPVNDAGNFSEEGENRMKHAADLICKRLKTGSPPDWAISKDFSFKVEVERRIIPKMETVSGKKTDLEGEIISEKENDSERKFFPEKKKNSKNKAIPEKKKSPKKKTTPKKKKNEPEEWEKVDFSITATKDYEFQYKISTSQEGNFILKDVRSVLLAIMSPMRVPGQDLILLEHIISSSNPENTMNELYTIFETALLDIGHLLKSENEDSEDSDKKENNCIRYLVGYTIGLVFEALSAWQEADKTNSKENLSSEEEKKNLCERWMKFKEEFSKISNGNKDFVSNIQFLGPQSLVQQSWENSQLEFFRNNKHSWVKTVDFAFVNDPDKIERVKGKSKKYSRNFFRKTKDFDYWINMLNVVKIFLNGVETQDKYVDFETTDEKTASYIYWVFMGNMTDLEKRLNFFKEYNITKCSKEIEITIALLEERKKKENNIYSNESLICSYQSNEAQNQNNTVSNGNKRQASRTLENEPDTFKKTKTEND